MRRVVVKRKSTIWLAMPLLFLGCADRSLAPVQTPCTAMLHADEETETILYGVPHSEIHWGPPNFGENPESDSQFEAWILSLDHSIVVAGWHDDAGADPKTATQIQLLGGSLPASEVQSNAGTHVRVEGKLEESAEPGEVTKFTLWASKIDRIPIDQVPACRR